MPHTFLQRALVPAGFIFLWSSAYIVVRMGLPDMSPIASLALRFAIATIVLVVLAQEYLSSSRRRWGSRSRCWEGDGRTLPWRAR